MGSKLLLLVALAAALAVSGCVSEVEEVEQMGNLSLASPAFQDNGDIPAKFTCQGDDINPPLEIGNVPGGAKSLVLIMDDPDAPMGTWDHWVVWNIAPETSGVPEDSVPQGAVQGRNSWGRSDYGGPCPPSGKHRYVFRLYALDTGLDLSGSSGKADVQKAMEGHVIGKTQLVGLYQKS
jgi:Raf kinase inhibitor-like YbhB/YbcL family protein